MKKILSLALVSFLMLGLLAACNDPTTPPAEDGEEVTDGTPADGETTDVLAILPTEYIVENYAIAVNKDNSELLADINGALAELKADGTLDAIVEKYIEGTANELVFQQDVAADAPTLTMGTNAYFPPYEFYEGDAIVGIDAEVAAAIADKLGRKLVIEDMEFDTVIASVQTGGIDMGMAGITVTEERQQAMSFTDSYATGVQVVIVKTDGPITDVADLTAEGANYKVGTQMGTTGYLYALWEIEEKGFGTVEGYNKGADAVQALLSGQVDCVLIDNEPAKAFLEAYNG